MYSPQEVRRSASPDLGTDGDWPQRLDTEDLSLPRRIASQLTDAIVEGRLPAGSRLREERVAEMFGTSRTPVREALRILEQDHLVQVTPRKGVRITQLSERDAIDIYVCRAYLYGLAAKLAASTATDDDIRDLTTRVDEMERTVREADLAAYFRLNVAFHDRIAAIADNQMLIGLMGQLGRTTLRFRFLSLTIPGRMEQSFRAHQELVAALAERRGADAEGIVRELIAAAGDAVLEDFFVSETPTAGGGLIGGIVVSGKEGPTKARRRRASPRK